MKFAKRLEAEAVAEWRPKYLQYKRLKKLVKNIAASRNYQPKTSMDIEKSAPEAFSGDEQLFLQLLDAELIKIDDFYRMREKEAIDRKFRIMAQLKVLPENRDSGSPAVERQNLVTWRSYQEPTSIKSPIDRDEVRSAGNFPKSPCSRQDVPEHLNISSLRRSSFTQLARLRIKKALLEYYRSLELIRNFKTLNILAITKILKKFDKNAGRKMTIIYSDKLRLLSFYTSQVIDGLLDDVENVYRYVFTSGDRSKALRKLRVKDLKKKSFHGAAITSGMFLMGCFSLIWRLVFVVASSDEVTTKALGVIYFGLGLPFILAWLFTVNAQVWERHYINYRFIFEYNQRTNLHICQYSALIGFLSFVYMLLVTTSLEGWMDEMIKPMLQPWVVLSLFTILFLWPGNQLYRQSRIWMARVFVRILTAPFYPCRFKDFFINDQYMSLTATFEVLGRLIYYSFANERTINPYTRPAVWYISVLQMLPATWRSLQCLRRYNDSKMVFPHLANLAKYLCSLLVLLVDYILTTSRIDAFWYSLIILRIISSTFSLGWDIVMDFGLWQRSTVNDRLRNTILFKPWIYWYLIISDTIARYLWVIPLVHSLIWPEFPMIVLILMLWTAEALRRFQWNFFRVEYEHINNCNVLRAVADVQLPFTATDLFYHDMVETIQQQHGDIPSIDKLEISSPGSNNEETGDNTGSSSLDGNDLDEEEYSDTGTAFKSDSPIIQRTVQSTTELLMRQVETPRD